MRSRRTARWAGAVALAVGLTGAAAVPGTATAGTATITQCGANGADHDLMTIDTREGWLTSTECGASGEGAAVESIWMAGSNPGITGERRITFSAPTGTRFLRARFVRRLDNYFFRDYNANDRDRNSYALGYRLTTDDGTEVERCGATPFAGSGPGTACKTVVDYTALNSSEVTIARPAQTYGLAIGCYLANYCNHWFSRFALRDVRGELVIEDARSPVVTNVTGPATSVDELRADGDRVTLSASDDDGLGLLAVRASVDGEVRSEVPWQPDVASCSDRDPGPGYAYLSGHPCSTRPPAATAQIPESADGQHAVKLEAVDAAGNATTALDRVVTIDRRPPTMGADPVVSGDPTVGAALRCTVDDVDGQGVSLTYQWLRAASDGSNAAEVPDATGERYTPVAADAGSKLLCRVTARDDGGAAVRTSQLAGGAFAANRVVAGAGPGSPAGSGAGPGSGAGTSSGNGAGSEAPAGRTQPTGAVQGPAVPAPGCPVGTLVTLEGSTRLTAKRAGSAATIAGAVRSGTGAPAAGVAVDLVQRVRREGVAPGKVASGVSGADGRFALKAPVGPSRDLQVVTPACGASGPVVGQSVRGQLKLRAVNPRVRNGQAVRFSGQAVGGYYGRGVGLELQVLVGRTWQDVRAVRTDRSGRFTTSYRFKRTYVRYTYRFRVITRATAGWPYTATRSPVTKVRVN